MTQGIETGDAGCESLAEVSWQRHDITTHQVPGMICMC